MGGRRACNGAIWCHKIVNLNRTSNFQNGLPRHWPVCHGSEAHPGPHSPGSTIELHVEDGCGLLLCVPRHVDFLFLPILFLGEMNELNCYGLSFITESMVIMGQIFHSELYTSLVLNLRLFNSSRTIHDHKILSLTLDMK